jgi:hypothetical protein
MQNSISPSTSNSSACNWRSNLLWAILGAALGNLLAGPMESGKDALYTWWLHQGYALHADASASRAGAEGCPKAK